MSVTVFEAAASGFASRHVLLASSNRATLSGVNSRQRKSGGLGKSEELVCACSAMSNWSNEAAHACRLGAQTPIRAMRRQPQTNDRAPS